MSSRRLFSTTGKLIARRRRVRQPDGRWTPVTRYPMTPGEPLGRLPHQLWPVAAPINQPLPHNPALDPNSAAIISTIASGKISLSTVAYGAPTYYATPTTPRYPVSGPGGGAGTFRLDKLQEWGGGVSPFGAHTIPIDPTWTGSPGYPGVETHFDGACSIVDVDGKVFSLFQFRAGTALRATWGGLTTLDSDITDRRSTGAGFSRLAGVVRREELLAGRINHALVFATNIARPGVYCAPATKTDGLFLKGPTQAAATAQNSIVEGQRIQLNPDFDLTGLSPEDVFFGDALKRFGAVCIDNGGGAAAPIQLIVESPARSDYTYDGGYGYTITDPAFTSRGITTDAKRLAGIPISELRVLAPGQLIPYP